MTTLEHSIIQTISFFDVLNMPLRATDVWQYLWRFRASKKEVAGALAGLVKRGVLEQADDFYVRPGRGEELVLAYVEATSVQELLWKKARRAKRWLQFLPFIRGVCVCNSLAFGNATRKSDIDLLIIVEPGHIWHARFLASVSMHYKRLRRHGSKIAQRICLSFFVTTDALDFESMKIADDDVYLSYWIRTLKPIVGIDVYHRLMSRNSWVHRDTPNFAHVRTAPLFPPSRLARWYQPIDEGFLRLTGLARLCEAWCRSWMKPRAMRKAKQLGSASGIVISEHMQKFHDEDRREKIRSLWKETAAQMDQIRTKT